MTMTKVVRFDWWSDVFSAGIICIIFIISRVCCESFSYNKLAWTVIKFSCTIFLGVCYVLVRVRTVPEVNWGIVAAVLCCIVAG